MLVTGVNVGAMERRHAETGMSLHVQDMPRANSDLYSCTAPSQTNPAPIRTILAAK